MPQTKAAKKKCAGPNTSPKRKRGTDIASLAPWPDPNTNPKRKRGTTITSFVPWPHKLRRYLQSALLALLVLLPVACQQDMAAQPSYKPLDPSDFFPDGRSARPLVAGTVPRGHLRLDFQFYTGRRSRAPLADASAAGIIGAAAQNPLAVAAAANLEMNNFVDTFPFPVTRDVLEQGRNRYMIYCVVCHDSLGTGHGKIVERGYTQPPSYHIARLRAAPVGHFFDVVTNGYGAMPDYRGQVPPRDRWAIAAYIRALQLSQHFPENELTKAMRAERQKQQDPAGRASE